MKKWSVVFGVLAFIPAAWAGPVLRWDGTETIPQFRRFDAAGKRTGRGSWPFAVIPEVDRSKLDWTRNQFGAMVMPHGSVVTGKTSTRLGAASSLIMNALKHVSGVDLELEVISDEAIEPISKLKTHFLGSKNPRLHTDETLMALSITSATSETAARVLLGLEQLRGCDAFFSVIISPTDETVLRKLGINVCCEPKFERRGFFHR